MAGKTHFKQLPAGQQVERLQHRAAELQQKAELKELCETLKNNPHIVGKVTKYAQTLLGVPGLTGEVDASRGGDDGAASAPATGGKKVTNGPGKAKAGVPPFRESQGKN